jgi:argininosuccinate lyase
VGIHLSNWAEDWIIWSTTEFDFIQLPQEFCTGSSIMPQKVNPDVLELIRGKTARVIGDLQTLLVLLKGLPMAYNRDLQEDKPPLFDACDTVGDCLELAAAVVSGVRFRHAAIARRIEEGYLDSTTLMEYLIRKGRPQRRAHHLVGQIVRHAIHAGKQLAELSLAELREFDSELDDSIYHVLGTQNAVAAFRSVGSSNPARVAEQISQWKQRLGV